MLNLLIYVNPEKDVTGEFLQKIKAIVAEQGLKFDVFHDGEEPVGSDFDALIVLGGDGTILRRTEFVNKRGIPIVGINCGKLGFLSEFELSEVNDAISLLKQGKLVKDERATLKIDFNGNTFYALNDAVLSRVYEDNKSMVVNVDVKIGDAEFKTVVGDGIIVSTPTGSTAYSMAAGGAILEPSISAFCITPVAAHSFSARSVVFSSDMGCELKLGKGAGAGLFVDGKLVATLKDGDGVSISKAERNTVFLRKSGFDFFKRLNSRFQDR